MNAKISLLVTCVEAIIYLLLHNLHDFTFNSVSKLTLVDSRQKVTLDYECFE